MSKKTGEAILLLPQQQLQLVLLPVPPYHLLFTEFAIPPPPGKTSNATASSSDSATCPGATATEPLTNGHTVESKKND